MATPNFANRALYHGHNLPFLRGMNSGTVHLIATDPPFNKGRDFHATPDSLAAGARFEDKAGADHRTARPKAQLRRDCRHPDRRERDGLRRLRPRVRDPLYLQLNHKMPRSQGGLNHISNRMLLCGSCNRIKSSTLTLSGIRKENPKRDRMAKEMDKP